MTREEEKGTIATHALALLARLFRYGKLATKPRDRSGFTSPGGSHGLEPHATSGRKRAPAAAIVPLGSEQEFGEGAETPVTSGMFMGRLTANSKLPETRTRLSFQSAQNQSQLAEVMIVKCLLGLGRIF
jgi:hypothetical protein